MATAISYSSFDSAKDGSSSEGGMWACGSSGCILNTHQQVGSNPGPFIGIAGAMTGFISTAGYTTRADIPFTWSMQACYTTPVFFQAIFSAYTYADGPGACPNFATITGSGTTRIGDGTGNIRMLIIADNTTGTAPGVRLYVGGMSLQIALPALPPSTTTAPGSSASPSLSNQSSFSTRPGTANLTGSVATGQGSFAPVPSLTWSSRETNSITGGSGAQTGPASVPLDGTSKSALIGGAVAGVFAGIFVFFIIFVMIRRRRRRHGESMRGESTGVAPPGSQEQQYSKAAEALSQVLPPTSIDRAPAGAKSGRRLGVDGTPPPEDPPQYRKR